MISARPKIRVLTPPQQWLSNSSTPFFCKSQCWHCFVALQGQFPSMPRASYIFLPEDVLWPPESVWLIYRKFCNAGEFAPWGVTLDSNFLTSQWLPVDGSTLLSRARVWYTGQVCVANLRIQARPVLLQPPLLESHTHLLVLSSSSWLWRHLRWYPWFGPLVEKQ